MTHYDEDPIQNPNWQALARECSLVRQLLGSGITALGKASYASGEGNYYVAFFGLSVGMERLAKLILVADYALTNSGNLPQEKKIRKFGHRISDLLRRVEEISQARSLSLSYSRPGDDISRAVVDCLDSFADATRGRYANFQEIGDPNFAKQFEPISKWWTSVAEPILAKHYRGTVEELKVNKNAELIDRLASEFSFVMYRNETGEIMQDLRTASTRTGETRIVQIYGRYYSLLTIRWLATVFSEMTRMAGYQRGFGVLFGHYEHFQTFTTQDRFLKTRKIWPLT